MPLSNPKKCLLHGAGFMFICLVFDTVALALADWLVLPCTDHHDVRLGLWTLCLDPDGGCVSLIDQWRDLPGWLRGAVGIEVTGGVACLITFLLTLACLTLPDRTVEESAMGLAMAALTSAAFIVVGQMMFLGGRYNLHDMFLDQDHFASVKCSVEPKIAHASTAMDLAWVAFATIPFAVLMALLAGMVRSSKSPQKLINANKTSRQMKQTEYKDHGDRGTFHYDSNDVGQQGSPPKKRYATKMLDAYREHSTSRPE